MPKKRFQPRSELVTPPSMLRHYELHSGWQNSRGKSHMFASWLGHADTYLHHRVKSDPRCSVAEVPMNVRSDRQAIYKHWRTSPFIDSRY